MRCRTYGDSRGKGKAEYLTLVFRQSRSPPLLIRDERERESKSMGGYWVGGRGDESHEQEQ